MRLNRVEKNTFFLLSAAWNTPDTLQANWKIQISPVLERSFIFMYKHSIGLLHKHDIFVLEADET